MLGISLSSLVHLDPAHRYTAQLFNSDYGDSGFEPGISSAQSLGLAVSITDYSHVSILLILLITRAKSRKKKKYNLFYRGKEQITK